MDERAALRLVGDLVDTAGDDAAVVDGSILTIDMLHERTDFPAGTTRYTAGWRAVGASLSDIAAMGGQAIATVAVYGAPEFTEEGLRDFIDGASTVSESVGASYVGGDLDGHDEFTVATAALGRADDETGRGGAIPGDVVCVTGALGRSAAGIRAFEQGDEERGNDLFRFQPRVTEGAVLSHHASAMMDSSDGLARSLHQLAEASGVGFEIEGAAIPVDPDLEALTDAGESARELAIGFGEDFELVCTMPESAVETVRAELNIPLAVVGSVTEPEAGILMDGEPLDDVGFTHGA